MAPMMTVRDPLVSVAGFKAHPTYLDLQNLRSGSTTPAEQDAQLLSLLIEASDTAQNTICGQPLQAHIKTENSRGRVNRRGELSLDAVHGPVRRLLSLSYGMGFRTVTTVTSPVYRVEEDQLIVVDMAGSAMSWSGSLQFGPPVTAELSLAYSYVAAYANTLISADVLAGAQAVMVKDPTGIEPLDLLRAWDPGAEENVQVSAAYVPAPSNPPVATSIPLVAPLVNGHKAGVHISGLPAEAYEAVVYLVVDALQRPGPSSSAWSSGAKAKSATAKKAASSRLYQRAEGLLRPYLARR